MNTQNVKLIIEAIESVKSDANQAVRDKDLVKFQELMGNLMALENCLVTEVQKVLKAS